MTASTRGFTLIELVVSFLILTLIVVTIGGIYASSVRLRTLAMTQTASARLGNAILETIRRDLQAMAFYPGKQTVYFNLETDTDGFGNRRDTLTFDALIPVTPANGITVYRFGRVSYFTEEQLGVSEYKKLIRRTVFINNEYSEDEPVAEETTAEEKPADPAADAAAEKAAADEAAADAAADVAAMEDVDIDRGIREIVLSRGVEAFAVDIPSPEDKEWSDESCTGTVPTALRVTISIGGEKTVYDDPDAAGKPRVMSAIFMPVLAPHAKNRVPLPGDETGPEAAGDAKDKEIK